MLAKMEKYDRDNNYRCACAILHRPVLQGYRRDRQAWQAATMQVRGLEPVTVVKIAGIIPCIIQRVQKRR